VYQSSAVCGTAVPERWRGFLRQQLRWKKSWSRESLRVMRIAWRWHPAAAAAMYASIAMQLLGPVVALHALLWVPLTRGGNPLTYLTGLYAMALLYGLFFAWSRRSPQWWGGIVFALAYSTFLCWQTYWAMVRIADTGWGTRASRYDDTRELQVSELAGVPVDCGLPPADDLVHHALAATDAPAAPPAPPEDALTRRDWWVGWLALPLAALPLLAGFVYR
jgi:hyaluronan synthase